MERGDERAGHLLLPFGDVDIGAGQVELGVHRDFVRRAAAGEERRDQVEDERQAGSLPEARRQEAEIVFCKVGSKTFDRIDPLALGKARRRR